MFALTREHQRRRWHMYQLVILAIVTALLLMCLGTRGAGLRRGMERDTVVDLRSGAR